MRLSLGRPARRVPFALCCAPPPLYRSRLPHPRCATTLQTAMLATTHAKISAQLDAVNKQYANAKVKQAVAAQDLAKHRAAKSLKSQAKAAAVPTALETAAEEAQDRKTMKRLADLGAEPIKKSAASRGASMAKFEDTVESMKGQLARAQAITQESSLTVGKTALKKQAASELKKIHATSAKVKEAEEAKLLAKKNKIMKQEGALKSKIAAASEEKRAMKEKVKLEKESEKVALSAAVSQVKRQTKRAEKERISARARRIRMLEIRMSGNKSKGLKIDQALRAELTKLKAEKAAVDAKNKLALAASKKEEDAKFARASKKVEETKKAYQEQKVAAKKLAGKLAGKEHKLMKVKSALYKLRKDADASATKLMTLSNRLDAVHTQNDGVAAEIAKVKAALEKDKLRKRSLQMERAKAKAMIHDVSKSVKSEATDAHKVQKLEKKLRKETSKSIALERKARFARENAAAEKAMLKRQIAVAKNSKKAAEDAAAARAKTLQAKIDVIKAQAETAKATIKAKADSKVVVAKMAAESAKAKLTETKSDAKAKVAAMKADLEAKKDVAKTEDSASGKGVVAKVEATTAAFKNDMKAKAAAAQTQAKKLLQQAAQAGATAKAQVEAARQATMVKVAAAKAKASQQKLATENKLAKEKAQVSAAMKQVVAAAKSEAQGEKQAAKEANRRAQVEAKELRTEVNQMAAAKIAAIKNQAAAGTEKALLLATATKAKQLAAAQTAAHVARQRAEEARAAEMQATKKLLEAQTSMRTQAAETDTQIQRTRDRAYRALRTQQGLKRELKQARRLTARKEAIYKERLNANNNLRSFLIIYKAVSDRRVVDVKRSEKLYNSLKTAKAANMIKIKAARAMAADKRDEAWQLGAQLKAMTRARKVATALAAKAQKEAANNNLSVETEAKQEAEAAIEAKEAAERLALNQLKAQAEQAAAYALKDKEAAR